MVDVHNADLFQTSTPLETGDEPGHSGRQKGKLQD